MQIFERLINVFAPHSCISCGFEGSLVCEGCQNDMFMATPSACITCSLPTLPNTYLCAACSSKSDLHHIWAIGPYAGHLERLIHLLKFERTQEAAKQLATGINYTLPYLPPATVIMPIPSANSRIRQRGYDQTVLIAKKIAQLRNLEFAEGLERTHNLRQVGADRATRFKQAQGAYTPLLLNFDPTRPVVLVDDVMTTGATAMAAAACLAKQGVRNVSLAAGAIQLLSPSKL